ncbi:MAG: ABC transporter substrate-binding protein [Ezakiella sp.]|nr:ABC transporter substrate-binding protein [Bacillota bacterium]MDY3947634.1 ABC transporter substrate-binding protein [Ezakiella sp.]
MKRVISLLLAVFMVLSFTSLIKADDFDFLLKNKIVQGKDGGDLALNDKISRAELVKIVVAAKEVVTGKKLEAGAGFSDVKGWAEEFVNKAQKAGFISGRGDGKFYPNDNITKQEVLSIVLRAILNTGELEWPNGYIAFAKKHDIIDDDDPFDGKLDATRKFAFEVLEEAIDELDDIHDIDDDDDDDIAILNKSGETFVFTDDAGRKVTLPKNIERVGAAGNTASLFLYSIAPEKLVGWASHKRPDEAKYFPKVRDDIVAWGTFYGTKSTLNKEELVKVKPQLIVDFGQKKGSIVEDLDNIQKDTGIPIIFIEGNLKDMKNAYKKVGKLLGKEDHVEDIIEYIDEAFKLANTKNTKKSFYHGEGDKGLNTNPAGNPQQQALELNGMKNVIKLANKKDHGGNEVSMEDLIAANPDVIVLGENGIFKNIKNLNIWKNFKAVKNNEVYEIPHVGISWMGRPVSTNQILGLVFASYVNDNNIMSMDKFEDMVEDYYELFLHYDMSDSEARAIINSIKLK